MNNLAKKQVSENTNRWKSMDENMERVANMKAMADNFPFLGFKNNLFINNGSIGCFWECEPLSSMDKELGMFEDLLQHILPEESMVQVSIMADPRVSNIIDRWERVDPDCRIRKARARLFKETINVFDFRIFVSFSLPKKLKDCKEDIFDWIYEIEQKLKGGGLKPRRCGPDDLLDFADFFFHIDKNADPRKAVLDQMDKTISDQILPCGALLQSDGEDILINEEKFVKTNIFENAPKDWTSDLVEYFTNGSFEFPFIVQTTLMIENVKKSKSRIESWCNHTIKSADLSIFGKKNINIGEELAEAKAAQNDLLNRERRVTKYAISAAFLASKESAKRAESDFYNFFRKFGWSIQPKIYTAIPTLVSFFPTAISSFSRIYKHGSSIQKALGFKTTFVDECVKFMPIISDFKGHNKEDEFQNVLWLGRKGRQITPFSVWNRGENRNCAVVGYSGSGKSVCMQDMARTMAYGGKVFVLDRGKSFRGICYEQNGQFIDFGDGNDIRLNPFSNYKKDGDREEKADFVLLLKSVVCSMIRPNGGISDLEASFVSKAVTIVAESKEDKGEISDIRDLFLKSNDPRERDLGTMLYDFCDDGIYAKYFKGPSNISFEKDFVVIEFEGLSNDLKLKSVITKLILMRIGKEVYDSPRDIRKTIFGDEVHMLLKDPSSAEFVEVLYREARKYFASIITGTQSVSDYGMNPAAEIAYRQSVYKLFLKLPKDDIERADKVLGLSKDAIEAIKSIKNVPGVYSEGVLLQGEEYFPIRLIFDKFSIRLYSTTGPEVIEVENIWKESKCSWVEAIDIAMARKQRKIEQEKMELAK